MVFIDTNILVYASLDQDRRKRAIATAILQNAQLTGEAIISQQVLREFANVLFKKAKLPPKEIKRIVLGFSQLPCAGDTIDAIARAVDVKSRYCLQFYDALIVATAKAAGCDTIYSEDMASGVDYDGIRIIDPFAGQ